MIVRKNCGTSPTRGFMYLISGTLGFVGPCQGGGGGGGGGESLKLNESKTAITQFMSRKSRSCGPHLKRSSFETSNQPSTAVSLFFGPSRRIVTIRQHISPYFNHHCVVFSKSVTNYNPKKYSGSHLSQLVS